MSFDLELLISLAIVIGGCFVLVGSLGLVKMPDLMSRLHGPSKATTLGVGGCLIASMLHFWDVNGHLSIQELLVTLFLFITAPVTAHFIAKAHLHTYQDLKAQLPSPQGLYGWSTHDCLPKVTKSPAVVDLATGTHANDPVPKPFTDDETASS
jgi:multicomponent K+:H+ antiporter subunit G